MGAQCSLPCGVAEDGVDPCTASRDAAAETCDALGDVEFPQSDSLTVEALERSVRDHLVVQVHCAAPELPSPASRVHFALPAEGDPEVVPSGMSRSPTPKRGISLLPTISASSRQMLDAAGATLSTSTRQIRGAAAHFARRRVKKLFTSGRVWSAKPQCVDGTDVWPTQWGITRDQIKALLVRLREDTQWDSGNNVYQLVQDFVIPWTQGTGLSYALLANKDCPKEVNVMVSHAWGENAQEFLEALVRSTDRGDVLFICALSLYQAEDDAGPSIADQLGSNTDHSPFNRVLHHIQTRGQQEGWAFRWREVLRNLPDWFLFFAMCSFYAPTLIYKCIPSFRECATTVNPQSLFFFLFQGDESWQWTPGANLPTIASFPFHLSFALVNFALAVAIALYANLGDIYQGRMLVVPNRECDVYSRLWCVYEIFVASNLGVSVQLARTLARAGRVSSRSATCAFADDEARIKVAIVQAFGDNGYEHLDTVVRRTTRGSRWTALKLALNFGLKIAIFVVACFRVRGRETDYFAASAGIFAATLVLVFTLYGVFRCAQGRANVILVVSAAAAMMGIGVGGVCLFDHVDLLDGGIAGSMQEFAKHLAWGTAIGGGYICLFVAAAFLAWMFCPSRFIKRAGCHVIVIVTVVLLLVFTFLEVDVKRPYEWYPSLVTNFSFVMGFVTTPAYMCWRFACGWGIRVSSCSCRSTCGK